MALTIADFIEPVGDLTETMFPDLDLEELVTAWLAQSVTLTSDTARQRHWVLHRAYKSVANRFHAGLASESEGPVSASVSGEQFQYWSRKAETHLRAFHAADRFEPVL